MKLRCVTNSIRLRVRKSDLDALTQHDRISDSIDFGGGNALSYELTLGEGQDLFATFTCNRITITVPRDMAHEWIASEVVSLEKLQALKGGERLHILIEKDFPCRHTTEANREDTFYELAHKDETEC